MPNPAAPGTPAQFVPAPLAGHLAVLLWDVSLDTIDPQTMARTIVQRVIERGTAGDWAAIWPITDGNGCRK